jgi:hypothetical protein
MYLAPIIVGGVVIWMLLMYWNQGGSRSDSTGAAVPQVTGTVGTSPGGFDPAPRPRNTREELTLRGVDDSPQGPTLGQRHAVPLTELGALLGEDARQVIGRQIDLQNVYVTKAHDAMSFSIGDGDAMAVVVAASGSPTVRQGMRVGVSGVVEPDGQGGVRIRAARVIVN